MKDNKLKDKKLKDKKHKMKKVKKVKKIIKSEIEKAYFIYLTNAIIRIDFNQIQDENGALMAACRLVEIDGIQLKR